MEDVQKGQRRIWSNMDGATCRTKQWHPGLQNPRIITLKYEKNRTRARSWFDKSDRKSSSPRWFTSSHDMGNVEYFGLCETDSWVKCSHCLSYRANVIKKGCSHGARHGKPEEQIYYHQSFNAWKRCRKRKVATCQNYTGVLDRFLKDPQYREAQERIGCDEA